jgi:hypothetical protein
MYTGLGMPNPLGLPGTLDPSGSFVEQNPLPPPGRSLDGTADLAPATWANYPAQRHVVTVLLAETVSEGGVWVMTITPVLTGDGVAAADSLSPISLTVTVGATHTITALGDLFVTAFNNAAKITTVAGVNNFTRLHEIVRTMANDSGTLTLTGNAPGATFTVAVTPEAGGGSTITTVTDAARANLRIGIFVADNGTTASDGITPVCRVPSSNDTASSLLGIVADSNRQVAIDPDAGYTYQAYKAGRDVPIFEDGTRTVASEAACTRGQRVWVRVNAGAGEVAGAVNDTPDWTAEVITVTPSAANATNFAGFVTVYDMRGTVNPVGYQVAQSPFNFTSDGDGTAAEIVTGLSADLTGSAVDDYLAISGTDTLILTMTAGYHAVFTSTGVGVLAPVYTTAIANDHVLVPWKFVRDSSTGIAAITRIPV